MANNTVNAAGGWIYLITHEESGRVYVGQSVNPRRRWISHLSDAVLGKISPICTAIRSFGKYSFSFTLLGYYEDRKSLNLAERTWIILFDSRNPEHGFNSHPGGFGFAPPDSYKRGAEARRGKTRSVDARRKSSISQKGRSFSAEHREKMSVAAKRRANTPEWAERNRLQSKKNIGHKWTPEQRERLSKIKKDFYCSNPDRLHELRTRSRRPNGK